MHIGKATAVLAFIVLGACSPEAVNLPRQGWAFAVTPDRCAWNAHWNAQVEARDLQQQIWAVNTSGGPVRFEVADPVSSDLLVTARIEKGECPMAAIRASVAWMKEVQLEPARTWTSNPAVSGLSYCSLDLDLAPDLWDGAASNLKRHGHAGVTDYSFTPGHERLWLKTYRNCRFKKNVRESAYRRLLNLWRDDTDS